jgi:hypothetical protein
MADGKKAEQIAADAAEAVKRVISEAESRAAEILSDAEAQAARIRETAEAEATQIRERAEGDARAQIEAAKRALDELGGTLAAAASSALPKSEGEPQPTETEGSAANGDDAAERLVAMKLAVDGKDQAAIEAELTEKFGERDRSELLKEVLSRVPR